MIPTWNGKRAQQCRHQDRIGGGQNMAGLFVVQRWLVRQGLCVLTALQLPLSSVRL